MSYNDFQSGRTPTGPTSTARPYNNLRSTPRVSQVSNTLSAYDSFARGGPATSVSAFSRNASMAAGGGSVSGNPGVSGIGGVPNPYASNAYATSHVGPTGGVDDLGGGMMGGDGMDGFYMQPRPKSSVQGKWKDTVKQSVAGFKNDNWKVVVVKATSHDDVAPKGKHVRVIMQGLQWGGSIRNRDSPVGGIFHHLRKRLIQKDWIVVLKTLTIFHNIFREGNENFTAYVASSDRDIFSMQGFVDLSGEGLATSGFIRAYGLYLQQWCAMKAAIDFPHGKSGEGKNSRVTGRYRNAPAAEIFAAMPVIMDTVERLFALEIGGQIKYTQAATPALAMILRDLTILWVALSEGVIRLLDLFFTLPQNDAQIAYDIYKRFTQLVNTAQPFFGMAKQLNVKWTIPETNSVQLDLMESMEDYIKNGPPTEQIEPNFSSEEEYEPEPEPEPEPEEYYEPEPEYYSEEEQEPLPPPRPRTPTPEPELSSSSEEEEEEEEEESSSEEEEEEAPPPPPPKPAPRKEFDPLADLLGIEGVSSTTTANGQVAVYNPSMAAMYQRATFENTMEDRVNNIKNMMAAGAGSSANTNRGHVGMMGMNNPNNLQVALVNQQQANAYATNMYRTHQQQLMAYQSMAAYQYQTQYSNQLAMMQMQQRGALGGHMGMTGAYIPAPRGDNVVPAMAAEPAEIAPQNYRVKRGTKPTRINADDKAFGPLLDQMKNISLAKK